MTASRLLAGLLAALAIVASVPARAQEAASPEVATQEPAEVDPPAAEPGPEDEVVVRILVQGNRRYSRQQLVTALGQREGEPLDEQRVEAGLESLWRSFHVVPRVSYRSVEGGIELLLDVDELPSDFAPRFVGNDDVDEDELYEWAGIEEGEELYVNRIPLIRQRLIDEYIEDGFAFVEISYHVQADADTTAGVTDVYFEIREGPRVKVRDVVYQGNVSLPNSRFLFWRSGLEPLAEVETGSRVLGLFKPVFVRETLDADLVAMRNVYRDQGWLDAVVELDRLEFNEARSRVTVYVNVDEGPRYTVASLSIEGIQRVRDPANPGALIPQPTELLFPSEELTELCELTVGEPYERRLVRRDEFSMRQHFGEHGYISHSTLPALERFDFLEPRLVYDVEKNEVHVTYRLAQGQQHFIREIHLNGSGKTQDRVYRRQISVFPGDLADLKEIDASLRRIRNLIPPSTFAQFRTPASYRFVETADPAWKDLEFTIGETSILSFNIFASAGSGLGVSGGLDLRLPNFDITSLPSSWAPWTVVDELARGEAFHGAGQTLEIRLNPGTEFSTYSVRFVEPDIFGRHLEPYSLELYAARTLSGLRSHTEERTRYGFTVRRGLTLDSAVFAGYSIGDVVVDDLEQSGIPSLTNPLAVPSLLSFQEGTTDLAFVEFGYIESDLDFAIAPNSGHVMRFSTRVYDEAFGSDPTAEFIRSTLSYDRYFPVGEDVGKPRSRLRLRSELGVARPHGTTVDVPYSERFYLGGRTLRGFERRGVGPNQNNFPIGGETLWSARIEYLVPLFSQVQPGTYLETEQFTGGVFVDAGVLDPEPFSLDRNELRAAAGFSISLWLGLPLTLSFAWPLEEGFQDDKRVFRFDLGLR